MLLVRVGKGRMGNGGGGKPVLLVQECIHVS